jgi:hypothetical protein
LNIRVFHKNSTAKANSIGKGKIHFRDLILHDNSFVHPVTLQRKGTFFEAGSLFLRFTYTPIDINLIDQSYKQNLKSAVQAENKFEFFND